MFFQKRRVKVIVDEEDCYIEGIQTERTTGGFWVLRAKEWFEAAFLLLTGKTDRHPYINKIALLIQQGPD